MVDGKDVAGIVAQEIAAQKYIDNAIDRVTANAHADIDRAMSLYEQMIRAQLAINAKHADGTQPLQVVRQISDSLYRISRIREIAKSFPVMTGYLDTIIADSETWVRGALQIVSESLGE